MAAYQTFLRDCDCERGGILFKDNIPCCRWCRTPYTKGGMINYDDEHFPHSVKAGKGTANDVLNTEEKTWYEKLGVKFDGKWYTHPATNTYDDLGKVLAELKEKLKRPTANKKNGKEQGRI